MSVYVDPLVATEPTGRWPFGEACHLFADSMDELLSLAGRIGLSPSWLHAVKDFPHFDLTAAKRQQAVARGAIEVDKEFSVTHRRKARAEA